MDGYKLSGRDRRSRRGDGVVLYVRECFDHIGIKDNIDKVEWLWVKIKGKVSRMDVLSVTDCLTRKNRQIIKSTGGWQKSHHHQPLYL